MSNTSLYLFRFEHFQLEIPYTNTFINLYSPWTYALSFGSCLFYTILITIIFPTLTLILSEKFKIVFAKIHYTLLFFYSLFSFLVVLIYIIQTREIQSWSNFVCTPIPSWLRILSICFTLSKVWEWLDTALFIWRGQTLKKIGFLHIYHHATTFLLFLCVMNFPGGEKGGMLFNGFVHTLMYYHYGYRLPKSLRPVITGCQILQLITVTYIWHIVPSTCVQFRNFPNENFLEFLLPYALVPVYLLFFLKFFVEQYIFPSSRKDQISSKKKE